MYVCIPSSFPSHSPQANANEIFFALWFWCDAHKDDCFRLGVEGDDGSYESVSDEVSQKRRKRTTAQSLDGVYPAIILDEGQLC